jgi:hypothetical protein
MPLGPGKYDDFCTYVREHVGGSVVLIVMGGTRGNGFACQTDLETLHGLPELLESVAAQIRADRDDKMPKG